jgi:hypothetical protein
LGPDRKRFVIAVTRDGWAKLSAMKAFGQDVASRTVAGVLSTLIVAVLGLVWASLKWVGPVLISSFTISAREAFAWSLVIVFAGVLIVLAIYVAALRWPRRPKYSLTVHGGKKPTITLTHSGEPAVYAVTGRIVALLDGSANTTPAQFTCELQVSGLAGEWQPTLADGGWANIILGSIETLYGGGAVDRYAIGQALFIRRGKIAHSLQVPNAGAEVELTIRANTTTATRRFQIVRTDDTATVTEVA